MKSRKERRVAPDRIVGIDDYVRDAPTLHMVGVGVVPQKESRSPRAILHKLYNACESHVACKVYSCSW